MSEILKINDLWGGYQEGVNILRGISLEVRQGEAVGIIGLNGSGKSTLGKAIMNMIPFRRGEIVFDGKDITALKTNELSRRGISIMQQGGKVFPNLSVWDNLQLAAQGKNVQCSMSNVQLTEVIPLLQRSKRELQRQMADKLSGGQKHQLSLAMTLATHPRLVILDEPSAGLSPKAVEEMYQMLGRIKQVFNISTILIEQNVSLAVAFCNRCEMIVAGKNQYVFEGDSNCIENIDNVMFNNGEI